MNTLTSLQSHFLDPQMGASYLKRMAIFESFDAGELQRIYALGEVCTYSPGSNVIVEGELTSGFYVVLQGSVAVFKSSQSREGSHRLSTLGEGKAFGELSLIDGKARSATVVAEQEAILYHLEGSVWQKVLAEDVMTASRFYRNFSFLMATRLRELDDEFILSQKQLWKFALSREGNGSNA
jgi:CRP/FNR family transcriptional regulator, cyclic AMP receptor protein